MSKYANAAAALRPQTVDLDPLMSAITGSEESILAAVSNIDLDGLRSQLGQMMENKLAVLEDSITSSVTSAVESGDLSTLLSEIKVTTAAHRGEFDEFITALAGA